MTKVLVTGGNPDETFPFPDPSRLSEKWDSDDFMQADEISAIAKALIRTRPELERLADHHLAYRWKRKGGKQKGAPRMADLTILTGFAKHFAGETEVVIYLGLDNCIARNWTRYQVEALVYKTLMRLDEDEETCELQERPADFAGFRSEIATYGFWDEATEDVKDAIQLRLRMDTVTAEREHITEIQRQARRNQTTATITADSPGLQTFLQNTAHLDDEDVPEWTSEDEAQMDALTMKV